MLKKKLLSITALYLHWGYKISLNRSTNYFSENVELLNLGKIRSTFCIFWLRSSKKQGNFRFENKIFESESFPLFLAKLQLLHC
jgi:hypothetical protein